MNNKISDFDFLIKIDPLLAKLGYLAETYSKDDPHASLIRLRQFGEVLGRLVAQKFNVFMGEEDDYSDLLDNLKRGETLDHETLNSFDRLRVSGNNALHNFQGDREDVVENIRIAKNLGRWFLSINEKQGRFNSIENNLADNVKNALGEIRPKITSEVNKVKKVVPSYMGKDCSGTNFSNQDLVNCDFTGADLRQARFTNTNLKNAVFNGADVRGANFLGSRNLHHFQLENSYIDNRTKLPENIIGKVKFYTK